MRLGSLQLRDRNFRPVLTTWVLTTWALGGLVGAAAISREVRGEDPSDSDRFRPLVHHAQYEDFRRGSMEDGGSNLYISRAGKMQMIYRWDLNNDGFLDMFVGQDHDHVENADAFIYWGTKQGPQSIRPDVPESQPLARLLREMKIRERNVTSLPSDGGGRSLIADLNADGIPEIVYCNYIHNYSVNMPAFIYWGNAEGYGLERRTELPTLMAQGVAAADLNHDGFIDLVFANSGIEGGERFGFHQHLESYVYWNGPVGFQPNNRTSLPTISAVACATAELTGDDYPEVIFLNNNSEHKSLYIYLGSPDGFLERRREVRMGGDPVGLHVADFNNDGRLDLIVVHRNDRAEVFRGLATGLETTPWVQLETQGSDECQSSDLNRDGYVDLVFANKTGKESFVYWGAAEGFSAQRRLVLPTLRATDVALADFNSDGWTDVAFANERDDKTHDVNSYIYWNGPRGLHAAERRELQGFGAVNVKAADLNADDHPELLLINRTSGTAGEIDSFIYWGNSHHRYSPASMSRVRGNGQGVVAIADLNQDGWVDVAFPGGRIFWGGDKGFSADRQTNIPDVPGAHGVSTADLNRDGYLDLIMPRSQPPGQKSKSLGTILWGSSQGFDAANRRDLESDLHRVQCVAIADLNRDGELDLILPDSDTDGLEIFWGNPDGYGRDHYQKLIVNSCSAVEVADLNSDGWLDLIVGATYDHDKFGKPSRILSLLWGGPAGFSMARSVQLDGYEAEEQVVADFNRDGILDIATSNYHAYVTRSLPVFVYWGTQGGTFSNQNRSSYPAESSSALTSADFNQDGWLDMVVFSHLDRGDHGTGAHLYWGGAAGFSVARRDWLPTFGPHYSIRRDVGNLYDRRLEERYISEPLSWPAGTPHGRLRWSAETPHGTSLRFQLKSAEAMDGLAQAPWVGEDGTSSSAFHTSGTPFTLPANHTWVQYRVAFVTPDAGSTPILDEVAIDARP